MHLIDASTGDELDTISVEIGLSQVERANARLTVTSLDGTKVIRTIPGCKTRDCSTKKGRVPVLVVEGGVAGPSGAMCTGVRRLERGGVNYDIRRLSAQQALVTAERRSRLWTTVVDHTDREIVVRCEGALGGNIVAFLRANKSTGGVEMLQLDKERGTVLSETTVVEKGTAHGVRLFFHNSKYFIIFFSHELFAFDPSSNEVVWRR